MAIANLCSIEGCGNEIYYKTGKLCYVHYKRLRRHGDPSVKKKAANGEALAYYLGSVKTYDGDACLIWPYARDANGYAQVFLDGKAQYVSRAICFEVNGDPNDDGDHAAHTCGNGHKGCVTKSHLVWKTPLENQADRVRHGTIVCGEDVANSKLNHWQVVEIRRLVASGVGQKVVARQFGVSRSLIGLIANRQRWAHIG